MKNTYRDFALIEPHKKQFHVKYAADIFMVSERLKNGTNLFVRIMLAFRKE